MDIYKLSFSPFFLKSRKLSAKLMMIIIYRCFALNL